MTECIQNMAESLTVALGEFAVYEKMSNDASAWQSLNSIKKWVATEKIHGANFSFTIYKDEGAGSLVVKAARRNAFLGSKENFYGIYNQEGFIEGESEKAIHLYQATCERSSILGEVLSVTVYGELFGGSYPHPSVEKRANTTPVQREVLYCPDLKFMAFDISITSRDSNSRRYVDYDVCVDIFKTSGFLYTEPLLIGTLGDMACFPLGFNTTIPAKLGLPPLEKNIAEGIVVKPIKNAVIESRKGPKRVIFKRKVDGFCERKPRTNKSINSKDKSFQEDYLLIKYEMFALTTQQRVANVTSKLGRPDESLTGTAPTWDNIHEALISDILEEIKCDEDLWKKYEDLQSNARCSLLTKLKQECTNIIDEFKALPR